jgi:two-component system, sensor histidine kinase LadS
MVIHMNATWLWGLIASLSPAVGVAAHSVFEIQALDASVTNPTIESVTSGALDSHFGPVDYSAPRSRSAGYWLKLQSPGGFAPTGIPVVVVHQARQMHVDLFESRAGGSIALLRATELPGFRGTTDVVFVLHDGLKSGQSVYAHLDALTQGSTRVRFFWSSLDQTLARGDEQARMIALSFGALIAVALAALLIWFVLSDRLFILYATLFSLQALYIAYLSGQGFDWPVLAKALPLMSHAWNVPAGLSGAVACLFTREIADLRHLSPRVYAIFGWIAVAFLLVTMANIAKFAGLGVWVNAAGNILFIATAIFTLIVSFLAWRRGSRAAGWFLIAWGLLEAFAIATSMRLLFAARDDADRLLYYYGLPLSMVAAAILIALGVADRLREQRLALSEAERRAEIDPLTGVLNRRSLVERLDAAGSRARARGLPIALLFIDLDHFKQINDSYGHPAGDACLKAIIEPIHSELRQSDVIGRYGGEEFVVILSSADAAAAHPIAERILGRVASVRVEGFGKPIHMTCSIGIAASDILGVWGENLIAQADTAVYAAKRLGRNQVYMAAL